MISDHAITRLTECDRVRFTGNAYLVVDDVDSGPTVRSSNKTAEERSAGSHDLSVRLPQNYKLKDRLLWTITGLARSTSALYLHRPEQRGTTSVSFLEEIDNEVFHQRSKMSSQTCLGRRMLLEKTFGLCALIYLCAISKLSATPQGAKECLQARLEKFDTDLSNWAKDVIEKLCTDIESTWWISDSVESLVSIIIGDMEIQWDKVAGGLFDVLLHDKICAGPYQSMWHTRLGLQRDTPHDDIPSAREA